MPVTLPAGFTIDTQLSPDRVRVQWPATATPGTSTLPNLGFESGDTSYIKGDGWAISAGGLVEAGTQSAKFTGIGQSNIVHETLAPVTAGTTITASARISKGNNRQDFAGGAVVLQWFDNTLASLGFNVGNVVNTGTSAFQSSSVTANAPTGAAYVRLAASATRDVKGRATDAVTVDTLAWNHTFTLGGTGSTGGTPPTGPQTFTFRVRDANGCEAVATRTIAQGAGDAWIAIARDNQTTPVSFSVRSADGTDWTASRSNISSGAGSARGIGAGPGGVVLVHFAAIGPGVARSTNRGDSWEINSWGLASPPSGDARTIRQNRGRWFIPATLGPLAYSDDGGVTWAAAIGGQSFRATEIIAEDTPNVLRTMGSDTSDTDRSNNNGLNWEGFNSNVGFSPLCAANNGGTFVVFGASVSPVGRISRSTNFGFSWAAVTSPIPNAVFSSQLAAASGSTFVAVATTGEIIVSTDNGASFSLVSGYTFPAPPRHVVAGGGRFVIVGANGAIATALASNPASWSTVPSGTFGTFDIEAVAYIPAT